MATPVVDGSESLLRMPNAGHRCLDRFLKASLLAPTSHLVLSAGQGRDTFSRL